jgi:hypothetical protein
MDLNTFSVSAERYKQFIEVRESCINSKTTYSYYLRLFCIYNTPSIDMIKCLTDLFRDKDQINVLLKTDRHKTNRTDGKNLHTMIKTHTHTQIIHTHNIRYKRNISYTPNIYKLNI